MKWVTIKRIFRAGFLDFWRNAFVSFASILVMTVTLFAVGITIFAGVMLNSTISELRNKVDVSVYFLTDTPEDRILSPHNKGVIDSLKKRVITMDRGKVIRDDREGKYIL